MTRFVYGSTILVMLAMAIFGAFGAAHGMEHGSGCFAATAAGMPCMADIAESVNMHFNILRSFSTAVFVFSVAAALFVMLAYAIGTLAPRRDFSPSRALVALFTVHYSLFIQTLRWLARLEHSPSLA